MKHCNEQAIERLKAAVSCEESDAEMIHVDCDDILLGLLADLGAGDVAEAYRLIREEVGFWYA